MTIVPIGEHLLYENLGFKCISFLSDGVFPHHLDCEWNDWKMIPGTWFDLFLPDQTPNVVWREAKIYERFTTFQICQFKPNCRDFYLLILVGNDWVPSDFWLLSISAQSVTIKFPLMRQKVGNQTQTINRTKAVWEGRGSFERLQKPQFWQNFGAGIFGFDNSLVALCVI